MAYRSSTLTRRGIAFNPDDDALLRHVRERLSEQSGRASNAAAVLYGLRLAAAHLDGAVGSPVPLTPQQPAPGAAAGAPSDTAAAADR